MSRPATPTSFVESSAAHNLQTTRYLQWGVYAAMAVAAAYGLYRTIAGWWVCDDAFISFRYAKNLVEGHGLIYNIGERVEGYSNFLWTVITAGGMKLGLDPVPFSIVLGIISYLAVVGICAFLSRRLFFDEGRRSAICVPITALLLLLHHEMHIFATSGLETMWTTALVMLGFTLVLLAQSFRGYVLAGVILVGAALSRPDGLLFYVMAGPFILIAARDRWRMLAVYLVPLVILYVPYWVIRYSYYGYPFPNTYYAKSAGLSYYSQGWIYLWVYVKSYFVLFLSPLAAGLVLWVNRKQLGRFADAEPVTKATVLALLFVVPYTAYVIRVGGDFMFGRFWIVITPLLLFLIELAVRTVFRRPGTLVLAAGVLGLCLLGRIDLYSTATNNQISGIANEPAFYPRERYRQAKVDGLKLRKYFSGLNVTLAFRGQFAMHVYYSDVPTAIEAATGLTDSYVAHLPIYRRGRPGHEKSAPPDYLNERGVNFLLVGLEPPTTMADSLRRVSFDGFEARMIVFNNTVMRGLGRYPEIRFVDIPEVLDQVLPDFAKLPVENRRDVFDFFDQFYFSHNDDPIRRQAFERALRM